MIAVFVVLKHQTFFIFLISLDILGPDNEDLMNLNDACKVNAEVDLNTIVGLQILNPTNEELEANIQELI